MQMIRRVVLALVAAIITCADADSVTAKGTASITYSGSLSPEVKQEALKKAKANAIERYFAEGSEAVSKNFEAIRSQLLADPDIYVLGAQVLNEAEDKSAKTYSVVIRADLNGPKLANALTNSSAVANTAADQKSTLTFVFVARQQKSVQAFDAKVYKRNEAKASSTSDAADTSKTKEGEKIRRGSIETSDSRVASSANSASLVVESTSGGSTTQKADIVEWDVTNASEVNSVVTGAFSAGHYEVVEAEYVESLGLDAIRGDYKHGNDLSAATLKAAVGGVRAAEIPFLALGTLDVGLKDTDPVTGNTRVYVTVTGKVLNVTGKFPKTVSSVGPEQFAGLGPNESVARTNALKLAAQSAASKLINELNAKGVQ